jgi:hypothetical protein
MGREALGGEMSALNISAPTAEVVCLFAFLQMLFSKLIDYLLLLRNRPFLLRTKTSIIEPWQSAGLVGKTGSYHSDIETLCHNLYPSCLLCPSLGQKKDAHLIPFSRLALLLCHGFSKPSRHL